VAVEANRVYFRSELKIYKLGGLPSSEQDSPELAGRGDETRYILMKVVSAPLCAFNVAQS